MATGCSDFPNQVNNSLGFPSILRGTLGVRASTITDEMAIAAAEENGLTPECRLPCMDEWEVFPREAAAVARALHLRRSTRTRVGDHQIGARYDPIVDGPGFHSGSTSRIEENES